MLRACRAAPSSDVDASAPHRRVALRPAAVARCIGDLAGWRRRCAAAHRRPGQPELLQPRRDAPVERRAGPEQRTDGVGAGRRRGGLAERAVALAAAGPAGNAHQARRWPWRPAVVLAGGARPGAARAVRRRAHPPCRRAVAAASRADAGHAAHAVGLALSGDAAGRRVPAGGGERRLPRFHRAHARCAAGHRSAAAAARGGPRHAGRCAARIARAAGRPGRALAGRAAPARCLGPRALEPRLGLPGVG